MLTHDADGETTTSASANTRTNRRTSGIVSCAYPVLKCIWPQHVCSSGKSTVTPRRSSTVTTARPVCGNIVSLKHVMKSETRRGGATADRRTSSTMADHHRGSGIYLRQQVSIDILALAS